MYFHILKANPNHHPAGTPGGKGGQFAPKLGPKPKFEDYYTGSGKYGEMGEKDYEQMDAYRAAEKAWQSQMSLAVSRGEVSPADAYRSGWSMSDIGAHYLEHVKPLPPELYHVTTARDSVLALGLKTRDELSQFSGKGLGGGTSNTISFTTDKKIARDIFRAMKIVHGVLNGKISVATLMEAAKEGKGAKKPWYKDISEYTADAVDRSGNPYGESGVYTEALTGYQTRRAGLFGDAPRAIIWQKGNQIAAEHQWEEIGFAPNSDTVKLYRRKLSDWELDERRMEFTKNWLAFRESAGGPSDPLFIFNDTAGFKNIPEKQISMLQYKPKPNAYGVQVAGMKEYRVATGDIVILDKILKDDALPWQ